MAVFKSYRFLIIKGLLILLVMIAIDQILGIGFRYVATHPKDGDKKWEYYEMCQSTPDIAIFGSSRALHHYDTRVLGYSLHGVVINYGQGGYGVIYGYAKLQAVLQRKVPRIIILDVFSAYDFEEDDNIKYIAPLRRFTDIDPVASVVYDIDPLERWKQLCQTYRWNSEWYYYLRDALVVRPIDYRFNGFFPIYDYKGLTEEIRDADVVKYDPIKLDYLKRFIYEASVESKLFVIVSPYYHAGSSKTYNVVQEICKEANVPFFNFWNQEDPINQNAGYFSDRCHLNAEGAIKFSSIVAHLVKTEMN